VPAIVITGSPSVSTAVRSMHLAVVVEYLIKPADAAELLRCVRPAVATGGLWGLVVQAYDELKARDGADLYDPAAAVGKRAQSQV
jgi:DNA-binding NtrC family response regulator